MLTDGTIALRPIRADDVALLFEWRNDPENRKMFRDDRPLNFNCHCRFVERRIERGEDYWWIIEAASVPSGTISLYNFDANRRTCEFGRFIVGREHRGQGYGRRALALVVEFARSMQVERIACEVLSSNVQASGLYGSLGFAVKRVTDEGARQFQWMEAELIKT